MTRPYTPLENQKKKIMDKYTKILPKRGRPSKKQIKDEESENLKNNKLENKENIKEKNVNNEQSQAIQNVNYIPRRASQVSKEKIKNNFFESEEKSETEHSTIENNFVKKVNKKINQGNANLNTEILNQIQSFDNKRKSNDINKGKKLKNDIVPCKCKMNLQGVSFCKNHFHQIYMTSNIEDLIRFTHPILQSRTPLPITSWREKYHIKLRKYETVESIHLKNNEMDIQHPSQFTFHSKILFICDFCLSGYEDKKSFERHVVRCTHIKTGKCIYKDSNISMYEVDGENYKNYCRRLCQIGKFFLEHKTLFYDVEPFMFFVLFYKNQFVGFFSKEKESTNNLSCIVVLPAFQGHGYGYFLVDFSYKLSIRDGTFGTPEKPLSEQGLCVYKKYWMNAVYKKLKCTKNLILKEASIEIGMTVDDFVYGMELLGFLKEKRGEIYVEFEEKEIKGGKECKNECFI